MTSRQLRDRLHVCCLARRWSTCSQPHEAAAHVSMDPSSSLRLSVCVELLGLDRSASVEA